MQDALEKRSVYRPPSQRNGSDPSANREGDVSVNYWIFSNFSKSTFKESKTVKRKYNEKELTQNELFTREVTHLSRAGIFPNFLFRSFITPLRNVS